MRMGKRTLQFACTAQLWLQQRMRREDGQGLVEYALILAFIAILVLVAVKPLQGPISANLNTVANSL